MGARPGADCGKDGARCRRRELSADHALGADDQEGGGVAERLAQILVPRATGPPLQGEDRKAADDELGVEGVGGREPEQLTDCGRAQRLHDHLAQPVVQRPALLGQGPHHRLVGADQED